MIDKNLFLHDLSVISILKNEAPYLKEWLDYHLLAGVDHFYLYDNDSSDNQSEVAAPYIEAGLVDYISAPGEVMQMPVYNDAVKRFKFHCRYMAFIDCDEFIFPKTGQSIVEVLDEILSGNPNAAGLAINWQMFGSNGHDKANYNRGVLERFTRRALENFLLNIHVKTISDPRKIYFIYNPHCARYFENFYPVNENGKIVRGNVPNAFNIPATVEKIAVNHYYCKSREEFLRKLSRGRCDQVSNDYDIKNFSDNDRNEVFDDGILKYRAARAEIFSLKRNDDKIRRVIATLTEILSSYADGKIFDLETALTCRAVSTYLREKFPSDSGWKSFEEASLAAILKSLNGISTTAGRLLISELPNLLRLPYPIVKELRAVSLQIISKLIYCSRKYMEWWEFVELSYLQDLLRIKE